MHFDPFESQTLDNDLLIILHLQQLKYQLLDLNKFKFPRFLR